MAKLWVQETRDTKSLLEFHAHKYPPFARYIEVICPVV